MDSYHGEYCEMIAERLVENIIKDLTSRGGLGNSWDDIDKDIQEEITSHWKQLIYNEIVIISR